MQTMNLIAQPTAKLPVREKRACGLGDFASNLIFGTLSAFLMVHSTDIFGLSAAAVGTLQFVAHPTDAAWDLHQDWLRPDKEFFGHFTLI